MQKQWGEKIAPFEDSANTKEPQLYQTNVSYPHLAAITRSPLCSTTRVVIIIQRNRLRSMSDLDPGRSNTGNLYMVSDLSPSQAAVGTEDQAPWEGHSHAMSLGFVATAILISLFLIMAIFEHLFRPTPSFTSPEAISGSTLEAGMAGKLLNPCSVSLSFFAFSSL